LGEREGFWEEEVPGKGDSPKFRIIDSLPGGNVERGPVKDLAR